MEHKPRTVAARQLWSELNHRQQRYLALIYELDQEAEQEQRQRWHRGLPREPADTWRWIPYATMHAQAVPTPCQQRLDIEGLRDAGAGSTLAALARRNLLHTRVVQIDALAGNPNQIQVRLTPFGRATVRASGPDQSTAPAVLPRWITETLQKITEAGPDGLPKFDISRSAARRLGPRGLRLIEDACHWSYRLTQAGHAALLDHHAHRA
ncbi:hypothetical protein SUDANB105_00773 [Streptomyces sp. enrichment culture]|uniref:hypothetical protein n=1 Tax=Streptomyces sp. enrichment culture TaxID=1795815 RepID=UPI003F5632A2